MESDGVEALGVVLGVEGLGEEDLIDLGAAVGALILKFLFGSEVIDVDVAIPGCGDARRVDDGRVAREQVCQEERGEVVDLEVLLVIMRSVPSKMPPAWWRCQRNLRAAPALSVRTRIFFPISLPSWSKYPSGS
ncbi:hypothetical protein IWX65_003362 [Arthrobacter sp. CAN_A214]